jgi:hypothetical protein
MLGDETRLDAIDEPAEPAQVIAVELVEPPWSRAPGRAFLDGPAAGRV